MGLPIHRLDGSPKAHVFAYKNELDAWLAQKADEHEQKRRGSPRLRRYAMGGIAIAVIAALVIVALKRGPAARTIAVVESARPDIARQPRFQALLDRLHLPH